MSATWTMDLETKIFATVKFRAIKALKKKYVNISDENFTMDNIVNADAEFPNIYIHFMPSVEVGADLNGQDINAVRTTVQVEIQTKDGLSGTRFISGVLLDIFKELRFKISSLPEFNGNTSDIKRMVFRATRVIGASETI